MKVLYVYNSPQGEAIRAVLTPAAASAADTAAAGTAAAAAAGDTAADGAAAVLSTAVQTLAPLLLVGLTDTGSPYIRT